MAKSNVNIDVTELKAMLVQISDASTKAIQLVDRAVMESAFKIDGDVKQKIQKGKRTGKIYKRRRISHRASAPGEAPKTDTGRLASSIRPVTSFMHAEIGSLENVAKYGGMLEDGTATMEARPVFEPTLKENEPFIAKKISSAIQLSGLAR